MKAIEQNIEKEIAQAVMEEQPMQPPAPKRKKRLTESTAAKVIAFLLMLVMTAVTAGGVLGAVFLYSTDVYVTSETAFKQELFSNIAWGDGQTLLNFLIWNSEEQVYQMNTEAADSYCAERNISYVMVQDKTGRELWYTGLAEYDSPWQFRFSYDWANPERPSAGVVENAYTVRITVPLSSVFVYDDDYALANRLAELAYALRYWIYAIIAAAALLVTVCFIFLLCAAGHHPYVDGVRPGWGTRIPLDLLTAAVDQRMRSERMKTELITNVSHDIKTPLTSIINYADLIGKEPPNSEKIPEYAAVLTRQSERLKRLIEDLVEASKASTGNLEVNLAPCQPGVLLTQAAGEYEQKLKDAGLDLVTRQPETAVTILADGRRLWRVFDNLMNNICKYAQRGTRVYLTLEERDGQAVISFKNTSRAPLDIPAEELLERFVRGDAARGGEGNGLGLSIARSLTELQKGTLELTVDGDLFKVVLRFSELS